MIDFILKNWPTLAVGAGWIVDRVRLSRKDDLDVLRGIIQDQKTYTDELQGRVTNLRAEFDERCEEMNNLVTELRAELDALKKKVNN